MAGRIIVSVLLFAVIAVIGVFAPTASAEDGPLAFGTRDFPLSVDSYPVRKRDGTKEGWLVIYGYRPGDAEAERLYETYGEIHSVNGQTFNSAPDLYHYISTLRDPKADITFLRRADGQEVTESVSLKGARPDAGCGLPERADHGVTPGYEFCGTFYRLVTRTQLLSCARPAFSSIHKFLTPRSDPPCALMGQDVVVALGQTGCRPDRPSALVAGLGVDTRNNAQFAMYLRGDTDRLAAEAAKASWDCQAFLGPSVEPVSILGVGVGFDYPHFYYFGRLHVSAEKESGSWISPILRKNRLYMEPDHIVFAESSSRYVYEQEAPLLGDPD